jgi:hypothetical protein
MAHLPIQEGDNIALGCLCSIHLGTNEASSFFQAHDLGLGDTVHLYSKGVGAGCKVGGLVMGLPLAARVPSNDSWYWHHQPE